MPAATSRRRLPISIQDAWNASPRAVMLAIGLLLSSSGGCRDSSIPSPVINPVTDEKARTIDLAEIRPKVVAFCGDCHAVPLPESFPADAWYSEVKRGFDFYHRSGRNDLSPPPLNEVVRYYRALAPPRLELEMSSDESSPTPKLSFQRTAIQLPAESSFAAVSHLSWHPADGDLAGYLTVCDMHSGEMRQIGFAGREPVTLLSVNLGHPAHAAPCDLNADGLQDWVVADLGSFQPADHQDGRVLWLHRQVPEGPFQITVLAAGLGRVADVRVADFDDDGAVDLVVAEFGWQKTGRILFLRQNGPQRNSPTFEIRELDPRHGGIHVEPADLDGDGRLDFAALISQEHEVIEAFLNRGEGEFERQTIFAFNDPSFGSSGMQVVDLDGDGDLDIVYTNGDSLDGYHIKPYHAIHWLENRGSFPFVDHVLAQLPGAFRAVTGDLDGDGDLDIVACSYIPLAQIRDLPDHPLDSLIWLEQTGDGAFVRHRLEQSPRGHVALEIGDFDGDGDLDLAVGNFANAPGANAPGEEREWVTFWWNEG